MTEHDGIYRKLFSDPAMICDLLRRFVGGDWLEDIDASSFELVPAHYVSEELQQREQDLVWRVRCGNGRTLYVYILLELQSTVDRHMALRLLVYLGLLYQDLLRRGETTDEGLLPPALPLVLYNGEVRWWAPVTLESLIDRSIEPLRAYVPSFRYRVVDEIGIPPDDLKRLGGPVAAVIRVEQSRSADELRVSLRDLLDALEREGLLRLAGDVSTWLRRVIGPRRFADVKLRTWDELKEIRTMLEERVKQWEVEIERNVEGRSLRSVLSKQFQLRYGRPMEESEQDRLRGASTDEVDTWLERILTAPTPAELFEG